MANQVALLVTQEELSDIQMALLQMYNRWVANADSSNSEDYVLAVEGAMKDIKKLHTKCSILLEEGFNVH